MKTEFKMKLINVSTGLESIHILNYKKTKDNFVKDLFEQNKVAATFTRNCIELDNTLYKWELI